MGQKKRTTINKPDFFIFILCLSIAVIATTLLMFGYNSGATSVCESLGGVMTVEEGCIDNTSYLMWKNESHSYERPEPEWYDPSGRHPKLNMTIGG